MNLTMVLYCIALYRFFIVLNTLQNKFTLNGQIVHPEIVVRYFLPSKQWRPFKARFIIANIL